MALRLLLCFCASFAVLLTLCEGMSLLGEDWSPSLTLGTLALSILSMLSTATRKVKPKGDASFSRSFPQGSDPKKASFLYDDDEV